MYDSESHSKSPFRALGVQIIILSVVCSCFTFECGANPKQFAYAIAGYSTPEATLRSPTAMVVDPNTGELLVCFAAQATVVIFDQNGRHPFEFSTRDYIASSRQVIVDSLGHIFVLGDDGGSKIAIFDYNGKFLRELRPTDPQTQSKLNVAGIALDHQNNLYVIALQPATVTVYSPDFNFADKFALFNDFDQDTRETDLLGKVSIIDSTLVIPVPLAHQVVCYTLAGKLLKVFGTAGGGPGELSYPIDVASDGLNGFLVLDKHRHTVLHFNVNGKFIDEFGGMGQGDGWFYHPNAIVLDIFGHAVVSQSFLGRIQALNVASGSDYSEPATTGKSVPSH